LEETSYPTTRYQPPQIPDYSFIAERSRRSGPTLWRFFKIMRKWKVAGARKARRSGERAKEAMPLLRPLTNAEEALQ
jgi:hypothetical protein